MYFLPAALSVEEFIQFRDRVIAVREIVQKFGYGVQAQIAYDTRINASRISSVLRCRAVDEECLARIEAWTRVQDIPVIKATLDVAELETAVS